MHTTDLRPTGQAPPSTPAVAGSGTPRPSTARALLTLVRPWQWPKNALAVPLALLDTPVWTVGALGRVALAVVAFTLASSLVFVVNDIADRDSDGRHPVKRLRPIAAGRVSVRAAWCYAAVLAGLLGAVLAAAPIGWWPVLAYLGINVLYTRRLKHVPLLDVFTVAAGFVLRVLQGYLAARTTSSEWLLMCVFALSLLLSLGKRRHELAGVGDGCRPALRGYSVPLLDQLILLCAVLTVNTYVLHLHFQSPFAPFGRVALLVTVPFALLTVFRYLQILLMHGGGGDPVRSLLGDRVMLATLSAWAVAVGAILLAAHYPVLASWVEG